MKIRRRALALLAALGFATAAPARDAAHLQVYVGGQQRPDIMRALFSEYQAANPGVKVTLEVGGASSDLHQKYLNMVLTARDTTLDVFLIDRIRRSTSSSSTSSGRRNSRRRAGPSRWTATSAPTSRQ